MEAIVERDNLKKALAQVKRNKGAPGVDAMSVADLVCHLKNHWPAIRAQVLDGTYTPQPVRRVEIPKATGGTRALGIPTVRDRVVQAATKLILEPIFEVGFRDCSYGFRPGRSTTQALEKIRVESSRGFNHVLDADIRDFFGTIDRHEDQKVAVQKLQRLAAK